MAYITNADIEERVGSATYVQLADDDGDDVADVGVVDEVRLAAEGEVNSYLARRYAVPIDVAAHSELAGLLASLSLDLAEHRLRSRRPPVPEAASKMRDQAIAWLIRLVDGTVELPSLTALSPSALSGLRAVSVGEDRVLTRDELADH